MKVGNREHEPLIGGNFVSAAPYKFLSRLAIMVLPFSLLRLRKERFLQYPRQPVLFPHAAGTDVVILAKAMQNVHILTMEREVDHHADELCPDAFVPVSLFADGHVNPPYVKGIGVHGYNVRQIHPLQPTLADGNAVSLNEEAKGIL